MSSDEGGYIMVPNPNNPNQSVMAKVLEYDKVSGEDYEYKLRADGTRIKLTLDVDTISRIIDPSTNKPAINPKTGEPLFNITWGLRVRTIYSEQALNESRRKNNT